MVKMCEDNNFQDLNEEQINIIKSAYRTIQKFNNGFDLEKSIKVKTKEYSSYSNYETFLKNIKREYEYLVKKRGVLNDEEYTLDIAIISVKDYTKFYRNINPLPFKIENNSNKDGNN